MLRLKLQQSELLPMLIESALVAALVALVAASLPILLSLVPIQFLAGEETRMSLTTARGVIEALMAGSSAEEVQPDVLQLSATEYQALLGTAMLP
jgi:NhaP-type Na+/H+ and K+/H+ antiporter